MTKTEDEDIRLIQLLGDYHRLSLSSRDLYAPIGPPKVVTKKLNEKPYTKDGQGLEELYRLVFQDLEKRLQLLLEELNKTIVRNTYCDFVDIVVHLDKAHSFDHGGKLILAKIKASTNAVQCDMGFLQEFNKTYQQSLVPLVQGGLTRPIAAEILTLNGRGLVDPQHCSIVELAPTYKVPSKTAVDPLAFD